MQIRKQELFEQTALAVIDAVYRFVFQLCGNRADAEDLIQECFRKHTETA